jgi:hypothetical protein
MIYNFVSKTNLHPTEESSAKWTSHCHGICRLKLGTPGRDLGLDFCVARDMGNKLSDGN